MIGSSRNIWDFEPRSVPGCGLWLDAADSSAVTIATGVSGWRDKSGNAYNLTQSTTGSQPSYSSNLITFSNNTHLNVPQAAVNNLSSWSLFFVINPISSSNWIMSKQKDGNNSYNILSMTYNTGSGGGAQVGSNGFLYWRSFNAGTQLVSTAALATSTLQICNLTYDGTSLYFYKNGVLEKTTAGSFAISNDTGATNYTLGIRFADGSTINSGVTNFRLGEMILYSSFPDTTQRQQIEGYLSRKWGITLQNLLIPLTVSNCVLWLDADDSTKFTGGSSWLDKSGTNNHGINGTPGASTMPTMTTWTNGRKAARFVAGSKNSMKTTNSIANFVSYFMVARIQAAVGYGMLIINNLDGQRQFVMNTTSFPVELFWAPGGTAISLGSFAQGQGFVFCGTVTSGSGVGHMNGAQVGSNTNPSTSGSSQNYFGSGNGDGGYLTIDIAEILIYTGVVSSTDRQSVENYLSAKWNIPLSRSGVTLHPFNSIRPFLRRFNPIDISGCSVWFDGADQGSMTFSGSTITQWRDKSGNGYHATISSGRIGATYSSGLKCVYFQSPSVGYQTSYPANPTNETMFIVANIDSPSSTNNNTLICGQQGARSLGVGWNGGNATTCAYLNSQVAWRVSTPNGSYTAGTTGLITGQVSSGTSLSIAMNGATFSTGSEGGFYANTTTHLGVDTTSTAYYYKGFVMEILFYNSVLTTSQRQQVEGYLAYKWGLISPLPATHLYKKLPPSSSLPFSPIGISGCTIWLDANDPIGTGIQPANSSTISTWVDKSGNSKNMTVYAGSPVFNTTPSRITFNGSTSLINTTFTSQIFTLFIVYLQTTATAPVYTTSTTQEYTGFWPNEGGTTYFTRMDNNSWYTQTSTLPINTRRILVIQYTAAGTGANMYVWSDGTLNVSTTSLGARTVTSLILGSRTSTNTFINGNYNEVIQFDSVLTTAQRQQVEGYLADKWGIKSSLPSTHLYRSFPPSFVTFTAAVVSSSIVTANLIVNLDPVSYTASSTSWPATVGNTWSFNSAPTIVSTATSSSLSFNGSQYVMDQTGFTTGPASTNSFTIEVWFFAASDLTNNLLSEMGQSGGPGGGWNVSMMYIAGNVIYAAFWVGGVHTLSLGSYSANTWTQACYTYSGTTVTGYRNGASVSSNSATKQYPGRGYYCLAGAGNPIYSSTVCRIGGCKIYSSVLSAADVKQNFNAYAPRFGLSTIP